ncbi:MAG: glycerophosphoryl diester phosphodiesterase [marine bacterium B5-7]|nr:MAG: glycerophosphoryl diester phosphodiesterase [marine bacterium B5-7]
MKTTNTFHVGLFVLVAAAAIVLAIIGLHAGQWFSHSLYAETYFNESISGLEIGSPVKFRGVDVGKVEQIAFIRDIYGDENKTFDKEDQYIYVKMAISMADDKKKSMQVMEDTLETAIKHGLRVKLTALGFTGKSYINLDFFNAKQNPSLKYNWPPHNIYVPSVASTMTQISDNVEKLFRDLNKAHLGDILNNLNHLLKDTDEAIKQANVKVVQKKTLATLDSVTHTMNSIDELSHHLDDAVKAGQLTQTMKAISGAAMAVQGATKQLPDTLELINQTVSRANNLMADQQQSIESTIQNLSATSNNVRIVTENAKQYPSHLILGDPPKHVEPVS